MAKRRRSSDDDSYEDASYEPKTKVRKGKASSTRSRGRKDPSRQLNTEPQDLNALDQDEHTITHPSSLHRIMDAASMRLPLLKWYDGVHEARGMPWRKPFDPTLDAEGRAQRAYEVWISEIMLQQTQVSTVIPYYNKWMEKFPTIRDLAASDIEAVNAIWKGLGYYSRAARLLEGAKKAVNELGGRLPTNAKDLEAKIPGIGRYSAGAICSIAYNQCVPVLDGNVHRLLSRVLALHAPPKAKATLDILWAGAASLVEGSDRPGDVNQALIELGSTVCKVREPGCGSCPLAAGCNARRQEDAAGNDQKIPPSSDGTSQDAPDVEDLCALCAPLPAGCMATAYPMKAERKKAREELDIVNVVEWRHGDARDRWFLLVRRPEGGLLAGLHEFPTAPNQLRTLTASATQAITHGVVAALLDTPLGPYVRAAGAHGARAAQATSSQLDRKSGASKSPLYIARIKQAGDVIHVFSHIKKTYRVQWVVLEGGGDAPPLLHRPREPVGGGARTRKQGAQGGRSRKPPSEVPPPLADGAGNATPDPPEARWLLMEDVPAANVGTGVLKVWKQACSLWDDDVGD